MKSGCDDLKYASGSNPSAPALPRPLSRAERIALVEHVSDSIEVLECDHGFRFTEAFLAVNALPMGPVLSWLRMQDVECDCGVIARFEFS